MSVKLISYSKPVDDEIVDLVSYCARVSNPLKQNMAGEGLKMYLIREHHWSPFEMVSVCVEITTTRDISRQILRHRSFSFQEFSQRYAEVGRMEEVREARMQDLKNRQNSIDTTDKKLQEWWSDQQGLVELVSYCAYRDAIEKGIAKECARVVLPEGLTDTTMYMHGTLRSWIHYVELRGGNGTQKEHQDIALQCKALIYPLFGLKIN